MKSCDPAKTRRGWALALALGALILAAAAVQASERDGRPWDPEPAQTQGTLMAALPYTTLIDAREFPPVTLDPHWAYDTESGAVIGQVYESLVDWAANDPLTPVPQLATAWQVSADGKTYTFNVRSGVTFHAGGTLEAHDVAYSAQRAMLQGRQDGPQYLSYEALFGPDLAMSSSKEFAAAYVGKDSFEDLTTEELLEVCQAVVAKVEADDAAGTVTFHLYAPAGWFLAYLARPALDGVADREWMVANGDWDGDCATWQNWADPPAEASLLYNQANGTGPFRLEAWTADEVRLVRYDGYWRQQPAWPGDPSGPAALAEVRIQAVVDGQVRADRLAAGEVDMAAISTEHLAELEPLVWGVYDGYEDLEPTVVSPTATLRLYRDLPWAGQWPLLFCYDISTDTNPYIGSGALDGEGIPPDFFQDLHVRRAVNCLMDWSQVISEAYGGEAIRTLGPIPKGTLGYNAAQPSYAYSPTLATAELQQAWGGAVWSQGLSMTLAYREDDVTSQAVVEMLAENLGALNPAFHVGVVGLSRDDLLADRRTRRLPVYTAGWLEDYHHPHEWVWPFLHSRGPYADYQSFPPDLAAVLDGLIEGCAAVLDPGAAQVCYEAIQNTAYTSAAAAFGVQTLTRSYVRTEVRGYLYNPARYYYPVYYLLSKSTQVYLPLVVRRW